MALLRNLISRRFHAHLNPSNPHTLLHPFTLKFPSRTITSMPQTQDDPVASQTQKEQNKKPLSALFIESVGLSEKTSTSNKEEEEGEGDPELKKKLRQLEEEIKSLKENAKGVPKKAVKRRLHALFSNKPAGVSTPKKEEKMKREPMVVEKELSSDMVMFVQYLYENGYFNDANFVKGKKSFDLACFESFFSRGYIKFAAQKFANDNQQIAKWLSGSALKLVAGFGCPSIDRNSVFPAKRLRKFFEVPENSVCSKCKLQESCKFVNRNVLKCDTNKLDLVIVMQVIIPYALEFVHPQLAVSDQVKKSVSQLLNEVVKLSQKT